MASGDLFLVIPAYDYMSPLPSDFVSMAEKPKALSASDWLTSTAWMAGTVTSYDTTTQTLIANIVTTNGSGTLEEWSIAVGIRPGYPIYTLDTSESSVLVGTGAKTFVTDDELELVPGQNIVISNTEIPADSISRASMQPEYLDDDTNNEYSWWVNYRYYGETFESAALRPRSYKILRTDFYCRPKVSDPVLISGRYNAKPTAFTEGTLTTEVPWNGLFDEIFREGMARMILKGYTIPDSDNDFMLFFNREFGTVINSRARIIPSTGRTKRSNFM